MANEVAIYNDDENRDLIPQDDKSSSEIITLPKQEKEYSIMPTIVSNAFNKYYWDKRNVEDADIVDEPINMPQPERVGLPPAKERGRTIDSVSGDSINMPQPERQGLPTAKERGRTIDSASGDPINMPQPERQGLPIPPEVKLFQEKQKSPIVDMEKGKGKKSSEVGKTLLKTLGKGASFVLPYIVKAAAAGIDNLAALPKIALEGSMSPEQKALYGGGLAGAFANVSAAAPLPVTDRMREISDALLLHRMQQKYIDMLKKQAEYMKTLELNGHQLDYLGRQASGIAFMNNKAPGAISGIKR